MQRLVRGREIGPQALARPLGEAGLYGARIAALGLLLADLDDLTQTSRGRHIRDAQAHEVRAAETGVDRHVEQRQIPPRPFLAQDETDQGNLVGRQRWLFPDNAPLVPDRLGGGHPGQILACSYGIKARNLA